MVMEKQYQIQLPPYFNWTAILSYLNRDPKEPMYQVCNNRVRRAFQYSDHQYLVEISYHDSYLEIGLLNDVSYLEPLQKNIIPFVKDWLDLDTDLTGFYQMAAHDDILHGLVKKFAGLRLVGMPDFYEALSWSILGQEINLAYTYQLKRRFTQTFGNYIAYQGKKYWLYPAPTVVAHVSQKDLLSLGLTHRKAEYLSDISREIADGKISKQYYQGMKTAAQAEREMTKLRGIGPWTANYVLMRCLRMGDAFPMADIGLLNGIKKIKGLSAKPDRSYLLQLKSRWQNWASYATFYIWRELY